MRRSRCEIKTAIDPSSEKFPLQFGLDLASKKGIFSSVNSSLFQRLLLAGLPVFLSIQVSAFPLPVINLWPNKPPGEQSILPEERDSTKPSDGLVAGKSVIRLGNVSLPTLQVFRPPIDKDNGTSVLVLPGGGYHILAMDLEGSEVCEWLNSIGVTGLLVKYRVPKRDGLSENIAPHQDAQRALSLARFHAKEWGINPQRIGVMGFSAGGHLAARLSNNFNDRSYPKIDAADQSSCRPDFTLLIYPAYLTDKAAGDRLNSQLPVSNNTPPTFLAIAQDDPVRVENALQYAIALQASKVPLELHIYPNGGHGYGLRRTQEPVTTWPDRAADWLGRRGLLEKK